MLTDAAQARWRLIPGLPAESRPDHRVGTPSRDRGDERVDLAGRMLSIAINADHDVIATAKRVAKTGSDYVPHAEVLAQSQVLNAGRRGDLERLVFGRIVNDEDVEIWLVGAQRGNDSRKAASLVARGNEGEHLHVGLAESIWQVSGRPASPRARQRLPIVWDG